MKAWEALSILEALDPNAEVTLVIIPPVSKTECPKHFVNPALLNTGIYYRTEDRAEFNDNYGLYGDH